MTVYEETVAEWVAETSEKLAGAFEEMVKGGPTLPGGILFPFLGSNDYAERLCTALRERILDADVSFVNSEFRCIKIIRTAGADDPVVVVKVPT